MVCTPSSSSLVVILLILSSTGHVLCQSCCNSIISSMPFCHISFATDYICMDCIDFSKPSTEFVTFLLHVILILSFPTILNNVCLLRIFLVQTTGTLEDRRLPSPFSNTLNAPVLQIHPGRPKWEWTVVTTSSQPRHLLLPTSLFQKHSENSLLHPWICPQAWTLVKSWSVSWQTFPQTTTCYPKNG